MMRIYEIRHPRTGLPVYVGCTRLPLEKRLRSHRHQGSSGSALVAAWIRRVRRKPTVVLVATARTKAAGERKEGEHIRRLVASGVELLNRKKNPRAPKWQDHTPSCTNHPGRCSICRRANLDTLRRLA